MSVERKRLCNIVFEGTVPLEIIVYAAITNCKPKKKFPYPVKMKIYYGPRCPACRRLFMYVIDTAGIEALALSIEFPRYKNRVKELVGEVVTPVFELHNGAVLRGCPIEYEEFNRRLLVALKGEISRGIVKPGKRII